MAKINGWAKVIIPAIIAAVLMACVGFAGWALSKTAELDKVVATETKYNKLKHDNLEKTDKLLAKIMDEQKVMIIKQQDVSIEIRGSLSRIEGKLEP